jgi:hypothetical protein
MFDYENADLIHAEVKEYTIYGQDYIVEFGVYLDLESENAYKYALLEESYFKHKDFTKSQSYTKTKDLIINVLEERKKTLELRSKL